MIRAGVLVLVLLLPIAWGVASADSAEARAGNGLIAYSQENDRCNDDGCNSYVFTVGSRGRGGRKLGCSTGRRYCRDVLPVFAPGGMRLATAANDVRYVEDDRGRLLPEDLLAVRGIRGDVKGTIPQLGTGITAVAWSADARQLGFSSLRGIYTVRRDGTEQELFSEERASDLAWSRQGRLAWTPLDGGRVRVSNKARTRIRTLRVRASNLAWSPSGRRVAYTTPTDSYVRTMSPNGRNRRLITKRCDGPQTGFDFESDIAWSPDGRQLLCSTSEDRLLAVNVRTGRMRTVVRGSVGNAITSFDWQRAPRR